MRAGVQTSPACVVPPAWGRLCNARVPSALCAVWLPAGLNRRREQQHSTGMPVFACAGPWHVPDDHGAAAASSCRLASLGCFIELLGRLLCSTAGGITAAAVSGSLFTYGSLGSISCATTRAVHRRAGCLHRLVSKHVDWRGLARAGQAMACLWSAEVQPRRPPNDGGAHCADMVGRGGDGRAEVMECQAKVVSCVAAALLPRRWARNGKYCFDSRFAHQASCTGLEGCSTTRGQAPPALQVLAGFPPKNGSNC